MWDTTGLEEDCTTEPEEKDVCVCIEDLNSCVSMSPSVALRGPRFHLPKPHGTASAFVILQTTQYERIETIDAFHLERLVRSVLAKKQNPYMKPPYRKKTDFDGIISFLELGQKFSGKIHTRSDL